MNKQLKVFERVAILIVKPSLRVRPRDSVGRARKMQRLNIKDAISTIPLVCSLRAATSFSFQMIQISFIAEGV